MFFFFCLFRLKLLAERVNERNKEFAERKRNIKMNRVQGGPTRGVYGHDVNMMMDGEPMNHKTSMKRNREAMITNGVMMATPPSAEINYYKSGEWERRRKKELITTTHRTAQPKPPFPLPLFCYD